MKIFILITAIIELVAGVALFIAPELSPDLKDGSPIAITLARMYGAAALAVGYYAILVWRHYNPGPAQGFLKTFIVFHLGVAAAAYSGYNSGISNFMVVAILHFVLAAVTMFFFFKGKK